MVNWTICIRTICPSLVVLHIARTTPQSCRGSCRHPATRRASWAVTPRQTHQWKTTPRDTKGTKVTNHTAKDTKGTKHTTQTQTVNVVLHLARTTPLSNRGSCRHPVTRRTAWAFTSKADSSSWKPHTQLTIETKVTNSCQKKCRYGTHKLLHEHT